MLEHVTVIIGVFPRNEFLLVTPNVAFRIFTRFQTRHVDTAEISEVIIIEEGRTWLGRKRGRGSRLKVRE